jgi:hypothetical protein
MRVQISAWVESSRDSTLTKFPGLCHMGKLRVEWRGAWAGQEGPCAPIMGSKQPGIRTTVLIASPATAQILTTISQY